MHPHDVTPACMIGQVSIVGDLERFPLWSVRAARGERALRWPVGSSRPFGHPGGTQHSLDRFNSPGATHPASAMVAVVAMVTAMMAVVGVEGQAKIHIQRRCYVCRSRGELGDCRDQFIPPEPLPPGTPVQVFLFLSDGSN